MSTPRTILCVLLLLVASFGKSLSQWVITNNPFGGGYLRVNCFVPKESKIFAGCTGGGVFVSTDNGGSWTPVNVGLKSKEVGSLAVRGATLYAGTGADLYASTNDGASWDSINVMVGGPFTSIGNRLFGGGQNGEFGSSNSGAAWTQGIPGYYGFAAHLAAVDSILVLGSFNGAYRSTDYGEFWGPADNGLPFNKIFGALSSNGMYFFAAVSDSGVYRSTDRGSSWNRSNSGLPANTEWHLAPSGTTMFAGTYGNGVYVSNNNGALWSEANTGLPNKFIRSIAPIGTDVFIGLFEGSVYRRPIAQMTTSVEPLGNETHLTYALSQNYPNPFNPSTTIQFSIPKAGFVTLDIVNALGQEVAQPVSQQMNPGTYASEWNASGFASGVYFYRLRAGDFMETRSLLLMK